MGEREEGLRHVAVGVGTLHAAAARAHHRGDCGGREELERMAGNGRLDGGAESPGEYARCGGIVPGERAKVV